MMSIRQYGVARTLAVISFVAAGRLGAQQFAADIPANAFARPSGPYGVGAANWLWVDAKRPEPYTKDPHDVRKLPVQVWYPANVPSDAPRAPYVLTPTEFGPSSPLKTLAHVVTNSVLDAPVSNGERTYPVIVYNHGAGWPRFSATFITEVLASHGYIVISIDHPGMDQTVLFSDGTTFRPDTLLGPRPGANTDARTGLAATNDFLNTVAFPIWIEDSRFVLDKLAELNHAAGPFRGRLDLDRIGMLGWSFGGAAALEMLRTDPRVKAAVNHDGRLFGGTMSQPIGRPFMMFHHGINDLSGVPDAIRAAAQENLATIFALDSAARARATSAWYDVTIARTNHGHFSDLPLFMTLFKDTTLLGARRDHEIISAYTLAFFDRYLEGRMSPLLDGTTSPFAEATFRASKPK
jgi:predicted dienelactone hydrolase